ncbi:hypothetical protein AMJ80_11980 [bacterium SM23_31]|nr:MAG: hypothetical protein AMJ80_11980 [bacterium SM23_31]
MKYFIICKCFLFEVLTFNHTVITSPVPHFSTDQVREAAGYAGIRYKKADNFESLLFLFVFI